MANKAFKYTFKLNFFKIGGELTFPYTVQTDKLRVANARVLHASVYILHIIVYVTDIAIICCRCHKRDVQNSCSFSTSPVS